MAKKTTFLSLKFKSLRIVLDAKCMKEVQGRLISSSLNGLFPAGYTAEFVDGEFTTDNQAVISAMREHPYFGAMFTSIDAEAGEMSKVGAEMLDVRKETAEALASTCTECGKKFANEAGLKIHMRSHQK